MQHFNSRKGRVVTLVVFSAFQATLEDCVSLRLLNDNEESMPPADPKGKKYSLSQLTELQNKLMLIATKVEQGREEANRFLEVGHSAAPMSAWKMVASLGGFDGIIARTLTCDLQFWPFKSRGLTLG